MNDPKMQALDSIIDFADQQSLGKRSRKPATLQPPPEPPMPNVTQQEPSDADDGMDQDALKQLMELYGKDAEDGGNAPKF